jgi:H/ACA ribonucleoprotein complex non-core subunit NAF1
VVPSPAATTSSNPVSSKVLPPAAPDPCAALGDTLKGPRAPKANADCDAPSKPAPALKPASAGGGAVVAAEDPGPTGKPKARGPKDSGPVVAEDDSKPPRPAPGPKPDKGGDPVVVVAPDPEPTGKPDAPARDDDGPKARAEDESPKPPPPPKPGPGPKPSPAKGKPGR